MILTNYYEQLHYKFDFSPTYGAACLLEFARRHPPSLSILTPGLEALAWHSGGPPLCHGQAWARECNVVGLGGCPRFCSHMRMCMHKQKWQVGVLLAQI